MLGPDCVLVSRTPRGFRGIQRDAADTLQKCALVEGRDRDLLFRQSQRIAEALNKGEIALAQIYGLHIPVVELDNRQLARIAQVSFARGYNPDEPRLPKGDPHGGEWTTGETSGIAINIDTVASDGSGDGGDEGDDSSQGGGDDGSANGDSGESSSPPAAGDGTSGSNDAGAANASPSNSGNTPPADDPLTIRWPDAPPPASAPPAQPSNTAPTTLGSPDLGDASPDAPQTDSDRSTSQDSAGSPSEPDLSRVPPPDIPATEPSTTKQVNAVLRSLATWLRVAEVVLGAAYELDPEVALVLAAIDATVWLADYAPKIFSYLDAPQTLEDLQNAATPPAPPGYEIHHIVEAQKRSDNPQSNAKLFGKRIDAAENLVRVPYWKHVEISSWYSTKNERYGGLTPRKYLRGKTWDEQYAIGLQILRDLGVLK